MNHYFVVTIGVEMMNGRNQLMMAHYSEHSRNSDAPNRDNRYSYRSVFVIIVVNHLVLVDQYETKGDLDLPSVYDFLTVDHFYAIWIHSWVH